MSSNSDLRAKEREATEARKQMLEALAAWREKHEAHAAVRLAFAVDQAETKADLFEDAQSVAFAEYFRLQKQLQPESESA